MRSAATSASCSSSRSATALIGALALAAVAAAQAPAPKDDGVVRTAPGDLRLFFGPAPVVLPPPPPQGPLEVTLHSPTRDATNLPMIPFELRANAPIAADLRRIAVENGEVRRIRRTGTRAIAFDVAPAAEGAVRITVPADAVRGMDGKPMAAPIATRRIFDSISPRVLRILSPPAQGDTTDRLPVTFLIDFGETVYGLGPEDILFAGSTVPGELHVSRVSGNGPYAIEVDGATGPGSITVAVGGTVTDVAGNPVIGGPTASVFYNPPEGLVIPEPTP
jgi:hypothetical protein